MAQGSFLLNRQDTAKSGKMKALCAALMGELLIYKGLQFLIHFIAMRLRP